MTIRPLCSTTRPSMFLLPVFDIPHYEYNNNNNFNNRAPNIEALNTVSFPFNGL